MTVPPFISVPFKLERDAPPFEDNAIKYPESLVRYFLKAFTKPGDKVLDPFAGLGTTLFVAEDMKRIPYGIESERQKYEWTAGQLEHWQNIIHGDAANIAKFHLPKMDFCMTSPPYMPRHHKWNPLFSGNPAKAGYDVYLRRMKHIFKQIETVMKKGAHIVVQADNLRGPVYTPLVRDLSLAIEPSFRLDNEITVKWDNPKPDYPNTQCLIFKKI